MNTWKAILAALVIFGAGLITGAVWIKFADAPRSPATARNNNDRPPSKTVPLDQLRKVELMLRVQKELNLSPEQRIRIEKLITDGQERIRDLWDQVAPEICDEFQDVKDKLYKELTPEQKTRFDDLMKQQQQHKKPAAAASTNAPAIKLTPQ